MFRFKYVWNDHYNKPERTSVKTLHHSEFTWTELFEEFREFLNGCGFQVPAGEWMSEEDYPEDDIGDAEYVELPGAKKRKGRKGKGWK